MKEEISKGAINIQLFADDPKPPETPPDVTNDLKPPETTKDIDTQKVISKELYDKLASELANLKKEKRDLENKGKTAEQLTADALAEKENELNELNTKFKEISLKTNKAIANSIISEIKAKVGFDAKSTEFEDVLLSLVNEDEIITTKNATSLNKLATSLYNKGFNDAKKGDWGDMSKGITSNGNGKPLSNGAKYAKELSTPKDEKIVWGTQK